jgi:hypothetical protein
MLRSIKSWLLGILFFVFGLAISGCGGGADTGPKQKMPANTSGMGRMGEMQKKMAEKYGKGTGAGPETDDKDQDKAKDKADADKNKDKNKEGTKDKPK